MISTRVRVQGEERVIDTLKGVSSDIKKAKVVKMEDACNYLRNYIQRMKLSGQSLHRRTGQLAGTFNYNVKESGNDVIGRVGSEKVYAAIHETGGTIKKKSKMLAIPISNRYGGQALTGTGVLRKPARQWKNTFVRKSKKGNLIIFQSRGDKIVPLFTLKDQVRIPKRPYIAPALKETKDTIIQKIGEAVKIAVRKANGQ